MAIVLPVQLKKKSHIYANKITEIYGRYFSYMNSASLNIELYTERTVLLVSKNLARFASCCLSMMSNTVKSFDVLSA